MKKSLKLKKTIVAASLAAILAFPTLTAASTPQQAGIANQLPVRETVEAIGAKVQWNDTDRTVTITKGDMTLVLTIGSSEGTLNGHKFDAGEEIQIVNEKTVVPASLISRFFPQDDIAIKANEFLLKLMNGSFAEAAMDLSANLPLPEQALKQLWQSVEQQSGGFGKLLSTRTESNAVHHQVVFTFQGVQIPIEATIKLDRSGLVDDIGFSPAMPPSVYQKPAYDEPSRYTEQEVVVGEGAFALPGTLAMPIGEGPFAAVVLVQGSGPHDRDSTIGGAKPFRDLAVGLAAQHIAVLRYEKVTKEHGLKISMNPNVTLQRETVDDALEAVKLLKGTKGIDPSKIFIAGHSQGALGVPKMIELDPSGDIAGAVMIAGPSESFTSVLVEQQEVLLERVKSLGLPTEQFEPSVAFWKSVAAMVEDPQYSVDNLPAKFPVQPAYWWYEQRDYVPGEVAAKQDRPMLILQGENDWQVSMKQFEQWKKVLKERNNVQYKSYPHVNHLLVEHNELSIGMEYAQPANVPAVLIEDIAKWILNPVK